MPPRKRPKLARFFAKVAVTPEGCWLWTGATSRSYPYLDGKPAHRYAYQEMVGPIPEGMTLDHLCHNRDETCPGGPTCLHRRCVNPEHLEPVDGRTNTLRSRTSAGGANARKTHCLRGHPLSGENVYLHDGRRYCRACLLERQRERRARYRVEHPIVPRPLATHCKNGHPRTPETVDGSRRCRLCRRKPG